MLQGKRILITGGAGFVGSHLAEVLADGNEIILLDNFLSGFKENVATLLQRPNVKLVEGDVRDKALVENLVKGVDVIFHEAAQINPAKAVTEPDFDFDINAVGTFRMLDAARKADVEKFLFASTNVYANPLYLPVDENHRMQLLSPYAAAKLCGEAYCMNFFEAYGLNTVRLRYTNIYGEGQRSEKSESGVIPIFIKAILQGKSPILFGNEIKTRDFVHVSDVVAANLLGAECKAANGDVFNVGTGVECSIEQLAQILIKISGKDLKPVRGPTRAADFSRCQADISKAKRVLGFTPKVTLEDGLRRTYQWWAGLPSV
jgi:UDP-glucose 4-epimerase